jgi:Fe2+ or Zn2+ uptake regulation protein
VDVERALGALNSPLRRAILQVTDEDPRTLTEICKRLKDSGLEIKYRSSVYRAAEILTKAGLLEKVYLNAKGICYQKSFGQLQIDLSTLRMKSL